MKKNFPILKVGDPPPLLRDLNWVGEVEIEKGVVLEMGSKSPFGSALPILEGSINRKFLDIGGPLK